jgi:hypothetical protein
VTILFHLIFPILFDQFLCASQHVSAAEDRLILIADDIVQKLLHNFALLFPVPFKKDHSGTIFLGVVCEVETLFFFINIIQFVLVLAGIPFELYQQCLCLALASGQ